MNIVLSIIIPVYNTEKELLDKCLKSIEINLHDNIEVLLIDDGSNIKYNINKKNIKYYSIKHSGVSNARNIGIDKASGKYIIFLDSDDELLNNWYKLIMESINKYNDADIIIFNSKVLKNNKIIKNKIYYKTKYCDKKLKQELELQSIYKNYNKHKPKIISVGVCWAKLYKREFLINNNLKFNINLKKYEDTLFNLNAFNITNKIVVINKYIYLYKINNKSVTNNYLVNKNCDIVNYYKEYIKRNKKNKEYEIAINLFLLEHLYILLNKHSINLCEYKNLSNKKIYKESIKSLKYKEIGFKEKIFLYLLKRKYYKLLYYLIIFNNKYRRF